MTDDECKGEFSFQKSDISHLCASLHLDDVIVSYNRDVVTSVEDRLAYPCRYSLVTQYLRSIIFNHMVNLIYERFHHLHFSSQQPRELPTESLLIVYLRKVSHLIIAGVSLMEQ